MAIPALNSTLYSATRAISRFARQNRSFAEELVFQHGLRGNVTQDFVRNLLNSKFTTFGKNGALTSGGKKSMVNAIKEMGLPKNASFYDILNAASESKKNVASPQKLKMIKF